MSTHLKKDRCRSWRLYAITCPERPGRRSLAQAAEEAILGGADAVQLRDKHARDEDLLAQALLLLEVTRRHGVPLLVNDRIGVAKAAKADGVHLGQEDGTLAEARALLGPEAILGRSTHSPEQALGAEREGFDYIGVGPVHETPTKAGRPAVGLGLVDFAARNVRIPFVAIGGIDATNIKEVTAAGARAVAVVRALLGQEDPRAAAKALLEKMEGNLS